MGLGWAWILWLLEDSRSMAGLGHDDVIKWKHSPRYWPFVRGIHRSPVNSPHKGQWRGVLMFTLICVWINGWVNNREAGDLRCYRANYDVTVMISWLLEDSRGMAGRGYCDYWKTVGLGWDKIFLLLEDSKDRAGPKDYNYWKTVGMCSSLS